MTDGTLSKQEARAIMHGLDLETIARRVWRATTGAGAGENNAAAVLDLRGGTIRIITWQAGDAASVPRGCVVLGWTTDMARERARCLSSRTCRVRPSGEVVEEEVARRAAGEGLCWSSIEKQLREAYTG